MTTTQAYWDLKRQNEKLINDQPLVFAFGGKAAIDNKLAALGLTSADVIPLPAGALIRKSDYPGYIAAIKQMDDRLKEFMADDASLVAALEAELANFEYVVNEDPTEALDALGLDAQDDRVRELLKQAIANYMAGVVSW